MVHGVDKRDRRAEVLRIILTCLNIISWVIAVAVIVLCFWIRLDSDIKDWVDKLNLQALYVGIYILIVTSFLVMASGFLSCMATFSESVLLLTINIAVQILLFILGLAGAGILMDNSTYKSSIHPVIKDVMLRLIDISPFNDRAYGILQVIQENMACCGANGPDDYIDMKRALPSHCRDQVTGNTYYYGCADEMTWFLEQRSGWIIALALLLCCKKIINAVLSTILIQLKLKYN